MKTLITLMSMLMVLNVIAQDFQLDNYSSSLEWTGYGEIGGFQQNGTINAKSGNITMENDQLISGKVVVDMKTITHSDSQLSKHLNNKDFFWTKKYPEAILVLEEIVDDQVTASMTIRGKTNEVSFPITINKEKDNVIIKQTIKIDRTLFDIKYNSSSYFQDLGSYAIANGFDLSFRLVFVAYK